MRGLEAAVGPRPSAAAARGIRAILFTSGTTGVPRAVQLSAANFEAAARASASNLGGGPDQVWLAALPLFHVGGLTMAHRCARYGATLVLHERFDAAAVWAAILQHGVTHLSVVATGLRWLLEAADHPAPGSLRAVLVGGGATPPALLQLARSRGLPVLQTYGLTESCAQVATERPHEADGESCGPALSGNQLRVEAGELWVRGPSVMVGYLGEPPLGGGWLRTGDLGALDDRGRLRVFSRRTDLIVTGGENVYPAEVEAVLASHPGVAEAAVVGLEDATWGQLPAALLVPRQGESVAELEAWCRARLAGFKVPRRFQLVAELPKTGAGKVDRTRARALAQAERAREDEDEGGARRGRPTAGVDEALDWRTQ